MRMIAMRMVAMRMVATVHAYYNVQYGRILHSCSMEHLYYAHLGYRINASIPQYEIHTGMVQVTRPVVWSFTQVCGGQPY